jgi:hypothetical protein
MKVYISGAITGTNDYMTRFAAAEKHLTSMGHKVFNPAKINSQLPGGTSYEEYMNVSLCLLDMCSAIYMLDGWSESRGANREYGYAVAKGKILMFQALDGYSV